MNRRLGLALLIVLLLGLAAWFRPWDIVTLEGLRAELASLRALVASQPAEASALFFAAYVGMAALSIPGAAVMTIAGGAIFGLLAGTVLVSFASAVGALAAFTIARFLFRAAVERRFRVIAQRVNDGLRDEGAYYLFALRLVPIFPFFVINLVMGLTRLPGRTFYWVSQLGMLPATVVYVNAGTQLARIDSIGDVLTPAVAGSFALLGIFPLLSRRALDLLGRRRAYAGFERPRSFDANLVVIGAGAAGLVSAYVAAAARARVVLIEQHEMGGDCLNRGCVPSKALIASARVAQQVRRARDFGIGAADPQVDFAAVMRRVHAIIGQIAPKDSPARYASLGVDCLSGHATVTSPWTVEVAGREIRTRSIVLATGGRPALPPIAGLETAPYLTSDTVWSLEVLPAHLLVIGGGPIGCELAQAFARLGSQVTLVEVLPGLLAREDPEAATAVAKAFAREGIRVLTGVQPQYFSRGADDQWLLKARGPDGPLELPFDRVLLATGRLANTSGLGLEKLGVRLNPNGTLAVNEYLQTSIPNIFACGDVAGPYQLTHAAAHQAWYCATNALLGGLWRLAVDYSVIPWAIFTEPEVARVGLTESEAADAGLEFEVHRYGLDDLDRALAAGEAEGFVKVLTPPRSDRILGATIVGPQAAEIIAELVLAMRHRLGLRRVLGAVHIYPTLAEANRFVAGAWQKAHLPVTLLGLAARFHAWRRGR